MSALSNLQAAIIQLEGSNPSYNNPGDITDEFAGATGETFGAGIPIYSTPESGLAALQQKLSNIFAGNSTTYPLSMTLDQFGATYSGNTPGYGANLANILNVPSSTTLGELASGANATSSGDL